MINAVLGEIIEGLLLISSLEWGTLVLIFPCLEWVACCLAIRSAWQGTVIMGHLVFRSFLSSVVIFLFFLRAHIVLTVLDIMTIWLHILEDLSHPDTSGTHSCLSLSLMCVVVI
jgi:hypothetical protein